jgi:hypothetical protein
VETIQFVVCALSALTAQLQLYCHAGMWGGPSNPRNSHWNPANTEFVAGCAVSTGAQERPGPALPVHLCGATLSRGAGAAAEEQGY